MARTPMVLPRLLCVAVQCTCASLVIGHPPMRLWNGAWPNRCVSYDRTQIQLTPIIRAASFLMGGTLALLAPEQCAIGHTLQLCNQSQLMVSELRKPSSLHSVAFCAFNHTRISSAINPAVPLVPCGFALLSLSSPRTLTSSCAPTSTPWISTVCLSQLSLPHTRLLWGMPRHPSLFSDQQLLHNALYPCGHQLCSVLVGTTGTRCRH